MILLGSLLILGWWVGEAIKVGVVHRTAAATSLYVENFIVTQLQELGDREWLSAEHVAELERLLAVTPLGREIVAIKIWGPDGRIVYGDGQGQRFPVKGELARAWNGEIVSHISNLTDEENASERVRFQRLLETYTPIRLEGSDRIIAVAEFYGSVSALEREIRVAQWRSWLVVGAIILAMYVLLVGLVRQGSRTIARQDTELRQKVTELDHLVAQNTVLHERVRRAAGRTAALNERFLHRISAELHDGPAQELSFALLRLDNIVGAVPVPQRPQAEAQVEAVQTSLERATQELRYIARGLRLPELSPLTLRDVATRAVRDFERRSSTKVEVALGDLPETAALHVKIAVYRLIQESLTNAYKHGGGCTQRVTLERAGGVLELRITDNGKGFSLAREGTETQGLGLAGMRERVESLGGTFTVTTAVGHGTKVAARIPLEAAYD